MADAERYENEVPSTYSPSTDTRTFTDTYHVHTTQTTTYSTPANKDGRYKEWTFNGTTVSDTAKIIAYIDPAHALSTIWAEASVIAFNGTMNRYYHGHEANIFKVTASGTPSMNGTDTNSILNGTNGTFSIAWGVNGTTGRINLTATGPASVNLYWKGHIRYLYGTTSN